jgi:hypothetical protein
MHDPGDELCARARAALLRIQSDRTFRDWVEIGEALVWCRSEAFRRSQSNAMTHHRARIAMGKVLEEKRLHGIHKCVRSHVLDMMEHLPAIEVWRRSPEMDDRKRAKWNYPKTILTHWKAYKDKQAIARGEAQAKKPSPARIGAPIRKAQLADLQQNNREQAKRIEQLERDLANAQDDVLAITAKLEQVQKELTAARDELSKRYAPRRNRPQAGPLPLPQTAPL